MPAQFRSKQPNILSQPFYAEKIIELSQEQYNVFCNNPNADYDFLATSNDTGFVDEHGLARCILLLCEAQDDGVLVMTEGHDYAKYTSYLPYARQIAILQQHQSLDDYIKDMGKLAQKYAEQAVITQNDCGSRISLDDVRDSLHRQNFDSHLFEIMLSERPEIASVVSESGYYNIIIADDYIKPYVHLRELTQDDVEIICAKHTLWSHDIGGEQADFSGCLLRDINLTNKNLSNANFDGAVLSGVQMRGAELCYSTFINTKFENCDMPYLSAEKCSFRNALFNECYAENAVFVHSNFCSAKFINTTAHNAIFDYCCVDGTDFGKTISPILRCSNLCYSEDQWEIDHTNNSMEEVQ